MIDRSQRFSLALALSLGILSGCTESAVTEQDVASWRLQELDRFGSLGDEGSALSEVADVAVTDSTILVLESSPPRVAVFNREGEWIRDLGRSGEGPGEFRYPEEVGTSGGNVWVGDLHGLRLEVLSPAGASVASHRWDIPRDSLDDLAVPTALLEDGSVLASPRRIISPNVRNRPYYRVTPEGEVLGLLYRQPVIDGDIFTASLPGGGFTVGLHPLPQSPLVSVLPDGRGLLVVERGQSDRPDSASFGIEVVRPDGGSTRFDVPYVPVPAQGWLDDFSRRMEEEMLRSGAVNREFIEILRESVQPRIHYPPVSAAVGGLDGSVWIRREEFLQSDSVRWQVFNPEGALLGEFSAPANLRIHWPSLEEVWAVQPGELDVPFVVRLGVESEH